MPKISVIIPVYKVEDYLHRCVDSVLNQTFTDYELILVDDGSPDNCGAICEDYKARHDNIIVIHKKNGGISDARNAGIEWALKNSDSEWLNFIDSDDWVHPRYLEHLFRAAAESGAGLSVCPYQSVKEDPHDGDVTFSFRLVDTESEYVRNRIYMTVAWGKLYRKSEFAEIRFPYGKIHEDVYTTYKLLFKHPEIAYLNNRLYYYYYSPNSVMRSQWSIKRLDIVKAKQQQVRYFKRHGYMRAYALMAELLLKSCVGAVDNLREHYPKRILLRLKYFCHYESCAIRGFYKFIPDEELKKKMRASVYAYWYELKKRVRKLMKGASR